MFDRKTIIILGIVAVVILGVLLWVNQMNRNQYNWNFTYDIESKEPYGGYAMYQMMQNYFPNKKFNRLDENISESLPQTTNEPANYMFVGYGMYLDTVRVQRLQEFVENGNNAYIFARFIPDDLMTSFFGFRTCPDYEYNYYDRQAVYRTYRDTSIELSLRHPNLKGKSEYKKIQYYNTEQGYWSNIQWNRDCNSYYNYNDYEEYDDYSYDETEYEYEEEAVEVEEEPIEEEEEATYEDYTYEEPTEEEETYEDYTYEEEDNDYYNNYTEETELNNPYLSLGYINDSLVNFVRVAYGNGYFYFYTTPIIFTNYYLRSAQTMPYASGVLAHLNEGDIYWDNESNTLSVPPKVQDAGRSDYIPPPSGRDSFNQKTPLQYILSERSFAWAWYLLLLTGVFYLFFRAKRKQRVIPVVESNVNTSLEFVETIGMLHWQQNDHRQLAMQQMRLLAHHIKTRYNIVINEPDNDLIVRLATVTELPKDHLTGLFRKYSKIEGMQTISEDRLIEFHKSVDYFYKNCK